MLITLLLITTIQAINQNCDPSYSSIKNINEFNQLPSCPDHSRCLPNGFCSCDTGFIGNCTVPAYHMQDQSTVTTTIS